MRTSVVGLACAAAITVSSATAGATDIDGRPFEALVEEARGGTVNFFLWGGDDRINAFVSGWLADRVKEDYGITINRVGVSDTAEVVNLVVSETEAGVADGGSVDLVWINGENFRTMKENGLLLCGWADRIPNAALVDWTDPSIATDFGVSVDGCEAPWARAHFAMAYDAARVEDPPRTVGELIDWIRAHPGRFTYAAPPDFNGSAFVRHVFVHAAGGPEAVDGPFDRAVFDEAAAKTWRLLAEIEPFLWRGGETYPTDVTRLNALYANGEVDFTFNYEPTAFGGNVAAGLFPETTRSFGFDDGAIANTSYVAVPANAANRAAAIVVADFLTGVEAQLRKADPAVWGMTTVLDLARLDPADAAAFRALPRHPSVVSDEELADRAMAELGSEWLVAIEKGWIEAVGR